MSFQGGEMMGDATTWNCVTGLVGLVGVGVLRGDRTGILGVVLMAAPWVQCSGERGGCWVGYTGTESVVGFMRRSGGSDGFCTTDEDGVG